MTNISPSNPSPVLPIGTQVVTRSELKGPKGGRIRSAGSVGLVVEPPADDSHPYRIRFPDGEEVSLPRHDFAIRKHMQREGLEAATTGEAYLYDYVIYRCVVGSRAFGLDESTSDTDRRGIYLPPAQLHWSLSGVPEQLESTETEETYWEIQKFLTLALKANPNILECLYTPMVEMATPLAEELLRMRPIFLSKLIYQTYNGYVLSQFKKLEQDLRTRGQIKWKHAMHLIRLLLSGITILREGFVPVGVEEHREKLLAIRRGEMPWEDVDRWRLMLHKDLDAAFSDTPLPERPDYSRANEFLIEARRSMVR